MTNRENYQAENHGDWDEVTKLAPCIVCHKPDWCGRVNGNGVLRCMRASRDNLPSPANWKIIKNHSDGGTVFAVDRIDSSQASSASPKSESKSSRKGYPTAHQAVAALEKQLGKRSAHWIYDDNKGCPVGVVSRWDTAKSKTYRQTSRNGKGWSNKGMNAPRPLYKLPELLKRSSERVYVCEGEKVADAYHSIGLLATTSSQGSNGAALTDWGPLAGRDVVMSPDNDVAGDKCVDAVTNNLAKLDQLPNVRVVALPGLPDKGDAFDFIEARRVNGSDDATIRADIECLTDESEGVELSQPTPKLDLFRPFPINTLPEPIRSFVIQGANAIGCDSSYLALPMLSALASAIGNTRRIQLKSGWSEPAIIWTAFVGESGTKKSPPLELALFHVRNRQREAMKTYKVAVESFESELSVYDRQRSQWKHSKNGGELPRKPVQPIADRCWCDDATVESLALLLQRQWRGLLMVRDELSGWLNGMDRYANGKGGDAPKWLEMFGGRSMMVDRKTGMQTIFVEHAAVSICGGIQPAVLRRALSKEYRENGLAARLLMAYPPQTPNRWTEQGINPTTKAAVGTIFDRLYELQPDKDEHDNQHPHIVNLSAVGKRAWIKFYNEHGCEQAEYTSDLAAVWSKLEGYAARFALVIHCIRAAANDSTLGNLDEVDGYSIEAGVTLTRWFGHEAKRLYAMFDESEKDGEIRKLVEKIQRRGGQITARQLQRSNNRRYLTAKDAERELDGLSNDGHGRWTYPATKKQGGSPVRVFKLMTCMTRMTHDNTPNITTESMVPSCVMRVMRPENDTDNGDWGEL